MTYPQLTPVDVIIPNGTALSNATDLEGATVVGLRMPAGWDAADLSFLAGPSAADLQDVHSSTAEIVITATVDLHVILDRDLLRGAGRFIQVRSGVSAVPINQSPARVITLLLSAPG